MPDFAHVFFFSLMGPFPGELTSCGSLQGKENLISSLKLTSILKDIYSLILTS